MSHDASIRVQVIGGDRARAEQWLAWLREAGLDACGAVSLKANSMPDVFVIDAATVETTPPADSAAVCGVVVLGHRPASNETAMPADAELPADAAPRELILAVRLVGKIVQQRRELRAAVSSQRRWLVRALTDPLTGLPNRRAWEEQWQARLATAQERGQAVCVAVIDLDRFKQVNDAAGHPTGDAVLRACSEALAGNVRHSDFLVRLGGDEFALLLADVQSTSAAVVVERARAALPRALETAQLPRLTASAGLCLCPAGAAVDGVDLLAIADAALCEAKGAGRDRTVIRPVPAEGNPGPVPATQTGG